MASSYKPALLKALVRLVRNEPRASYTRSEIATQFLAMYWNQTVVFHLRQAPSLAREPIVLREIRTASERFRARRLAELPAIATASLIGKLADALSIVLQKFHGSAPAAMPPLFAWTPPSKEIVLSEPGLQCLSQHGVELEAIANLWWARYLERVNKLAPYVIQKVEREGARRGSLARFLRILRESEEHICFYCRRSLGGVVTHVDHVLPWAFLLEDELWDLVLACDSCNLAKSDALPARAFVERLHERNERFRTIASGSSNFSPLVHGVELYQLYDAASALEWPGPWSPATRPSY